MLNTRRCFDSRRTTRTSRFSGPSRWQYRGAMTGIQHFLNSAGVLAFQPYEYPGATRANSPPNLPAGNVCRLSTDVHRYRAHRLPRQNKARGFAGDDWWDAPRRRPEGVNSASGMRYCRRPKLDSLELSAARMFLSLLLTLLRRLLPAVQTRPLLPLMSRSCSGRLLPWQASSICAAARSAPDRSPVDAASHTYEN